MDFTYEVSRRLPPARARCSLSTPPGRRGTDRLQRDACHERQSGHCAGHQQDRPASAHPDEVKTEIEDDLAIPADDAVCVSGKTGEGIHDLLESIVFLISPPKGDAHAPLKALILDSYFDEYRGVVATVRIFDGSIKKGDTLRMMQAKGDFLVDGVGVKRPAETPVDALTVGEVGYVVTGLKDPEAVRVGDTLTWASNPAPTLPGTARLSPWSTRACSRSTTRITRTCATLSISCMSTTRRWCGSPRLRWRSALVSALASWACCIWRSSRSAWSASSTWT
ncbi:MAG: EF-Tu/IF-2/RF-3 family GTPase [Collinsella sp.]